MLSISQRDLPTVCAPFASLAEVSSWRDLSQVAYILADDELLGRSLQTAIEGYGATPVWFRSMEEYRSYERPDATACLLIVQVAASDATLQLHGILADSLCPPVIILSADGDIPSCVRAIREGAHDYLPLPLVASHFFRSLEAAFEKDRAGRIQRQETAMLQSRWRSLTMREAEIMRYAVEGLLNKQTAAELNIAENTVQVHRGRVMRKMGAESFADLVRMSLKLGDLRKEPSLFTRRI